MQNEAHRMEEIIPVLLEVLESGGEFRLAPRGTSMLPLLREGRDAVALVHPDTLKKRDICLYRRADGSYVLHRLMKFKKGAPVFCGDNQTALEQDVPREAVLARVITVYRDDRAIPVTALSYRFYSFCHCIMLWRHVRFFPRRLAAFIRRKTKKAVD